jgi:AraC family transcriptional regulator
MGAPLGTAEDGTAQAGSARTGRAEIFPPAAGSWRHQSINIDGLRVVDASFAPYTVIPRHAHDSPGLGVLLDGELEIDIVGITRSCTAATVGTEPRWEEHVNRVGPSGARIVSIEVAAERLDGLGPCAPFLQRVHGFRDGVIAGTARRIVRELTQPDSASRLAVHSLALDVLVSAARADSGRGRRRQAPVWLSQAEELLRAHFLDSLDLDAIGSRIGVTALHLARRFREHYGVSPATYVRQLRIEWAAEQLTGGSGSISEIALTAGFADQSHFTREFKRHTGLPPDRYRRARRG